MHRNDAHTKHAFAVNSTPHFNPTATAAVSDAVLSGGDDFRIL
jgi:hypothetical protein